MFANASLAKHQNATESDRLRMANDFGVPIGNELIEVQIGSVREQHQNSNGA